MDRILKIYELLSKDEVNNLITIIPKLEAFLEYIDKDEIYKFNNSDVKFIFTIEQISKLSSEYELTITDKYLVINK